MSTDDRDGHPSERAKYKPQSRRSLLHARKVQTKVWTVTAPSAQNTNHTHTLSTPTHAHTCTHMHPPRVRLPSADSASPSAGGREENLAGAKVLQAATHVKSCTADVRGPSSRKTHAYTSPHPHTHTHTHTIPPKCTHEPQRIN